MRWHGNNRVSRGLGLWRSPDRQGQLLVEKGEYLPAAERFTDPMQRGSAYFKAGEFKKALSVYNSVITPEGCITEGMRR